MNWEAFGAIAEAIGAVGIILTLIYLAVQIRQNTTAQETSSVWTMTQIFNQTHNAILENSEVSEILSRALIGELDSEAEKRRMYSLVMPMVNGYFAAWRAYKNGHLSADVYSALQRDSEVLKSPGLAPLLTEALAGREPAFVTEFFD